jgi:hypothetical protein
LIGFSDIVESFTQFKVALASLFGPDLLLSGILESLGSPFPAEILKGFNFFMLPEFHSVEQIIILIFLINLVVVFIKEMIVVLIALWMFFILNDV